MNRAIGVWSASNTDVMTKASTLAGSIACRLELSDLNSPWIARKITMKIDAKSDEMALDSM